MWFIPGGPIIPNELLTARDEGQVVFFCGSGVSQAKAGLPDFYGLAEAVFGHLHTQPESRARAMIEASRPITVKGVEGLIPADRAFQILEREFDPPRVRAAVAASLVPTTDDLSAHRALIDLVRLTDGAVRLDARSMQAAFKDRFVHKICINECQIGIRACLGTHHAASLHRVQLSFAP